MTEDVITPEAKIRVLEARLLRLAAQHQQERSERGRLQRELSDLQDKVDHFVDFIRNWTTPSD